MKLPAYLKNEKFVAGMLLALTVLVLALALRGLPGNPTAEELNSDFWKDEGPLELSPDRGRFAITYSVVEDKSLQFSLPVAQFTTPDLAITSDGRYVSLFNPGLSFLVLPGYLAGKFVGASQVGTFAVIALFAFLNVLLLRAIAGRLNIPVLPALVGGLVFLFATPAFTYAVTLYQHHVSTFFILGGIYLLLRWKTAWSFAVFWLAYGAAIVVDLPNFLLMMPVAIWAVTLCIHWTKGVNLIRFKLKPWGLVTIACMLVPLALFSWFNYASHGDALKLPGTLPRVQAIDEGTGLPTAPFSQPIDEPLFELEAPAEKTALGAFKTRNLLNGFYVHLISPDRGLLRFAPVILLGLWGLWMLGRRDEKMRNLLLSIVGVNFLLYSMWGDAWGGWAFGSRYLIPGYAILALGVAELLQKFAGRRMFQILFLLIFAYSVWVNALGAITSSKNPPQIEVLALEQISGKEEKYTYERNWDFLRADGSKSFVYQTMAKDYMSAETYHQVLTVLIIVAAGVALFQQSRRRIKSGTYESS